MKNRSKKTRATLYFPLVVILVYIILAFVNFNLFLSGLKFFCNLIIQIVPIFILVFILMVGANYFISPQFITKHFREPGIKKWIFIIIGGILSTGPIFMWYPLLAELKEKGIAYGYLATFLYNRAIKIPLLPIAIFYFGLKYIIVLTIVMIFISIIQGIIINRILPLDN